MKKILNNKQNEQILCEHNGVGQSESIKVGQSGKAVRLLVLYLVSVGLLFGGFWGGAWFLDGWGGVWLSVGVVGLSSLVLGVFRDRLWSALLSCGCVSVGIGLSISTFYTVLMVEPSGLFGLILVMVLLYKVCQNFFMCRVRRKGLLTIFVIVLEVIGAFYFFICMNKNMGLYSLIGFAFVIAIFFSFGQLTLYKCGANNMWRTIALSYILGFVFIVLFVVLIILSIISEDGAPLEFLEILSFGDVNSKKKKAKLL